MDDEVFIPSTKANNKHNTIKNALEETRELLRDNTNKIIERDNHLNNIEQKTEYLSFNSGRFKKHTRDLKARMWFKQHMCCIIAIVISVFIVTLIIILSQDSQNNH